ncbi:SGNH hydrolase domain-containing protein [Herbiconiux sp. YIM B11900]|uniref:SGNH hydrolase domain-containing protein n=1 Tax=Herbiconiux sp. YIM B11900 TaxID=3404131 RepID=UPI003F86A787
MDPFIDMAEKNGWHLTTYLKGGCPWTTTPLLAKDAFAASCDTWRASLTSELAAHPPFDAVFTAALTDRNVPGTADDEQTAAIGYGEAWKQVLDQGTPIVTVVDNPAWEDDPNKCLRTESEADCTEPRDEGLAEFDPIALAASGAITQGQDVTLLDFSDTYCTADECPAVIGGANVYRDANHLTRTFSFTLEPFITRGLLAAVTRAAG